MKKSLYCGGRAVGTVEIPGEGSRLALKAVMDDPGEGLYRAALVGQRGELALGVMIPEGGCLKAERTVYRRDLEALGGSLRGEVRCSGEVGTGWQWAERPDELLKDPFLARRLERCARVWYRREAGRLCLAVEIEEGRPFPMETLFCLAQPGEVEGRRCVRFLFDGEGKPLLPGKE